MTHINYLLPNQFKKPGWILFLTGMVLGVVYLLFNAELWFFDIPVFAIADEKILGHTTFFYFPINNVFDEIICLLLITGPVFIVFSREKNEDEFITKLRLESLIWAVYLNYAILVLAILFVYGLSFLWVLVMNMFTILFFFIIRFNWVLYKSKKHIRDEK
jgi:hypothetical protein